MRILHLSYDHVLNPWGGGGQALECREINRRLARSYGHDITVVCAAWPGAPCQEKVDGVTYLFAHPAPNSPVSWAAYAASAMRRVVVGTWDIVVDDVNPFSLTFSGVLSRSPTVAHLVVDPFADAPHRRRLRQAIQPLKRLELVCHRGVIVVSPSLRRRLEALLPRRAIYATIPPGVDQSLLELEPADRGYILFLGRLAVHHKGLDYLAAALRLVRSRHSGVRLVVAGAGPDEERVRQLFGDDDLAGAVELTGYVRGQRKERLLSECSFVVMPSRFEGWGIVAVEAGACGKAVIGFDVDGLSDSIRDGDTGLLVEPGSVEALATAMSKLLEDRALRDRLGANGRTRARELTWDRAAERYDQFYKQVIRRAPR